MGNIFGRWEGSDPSAGSVLTGSHCDAIPLAGALQLSCYTLCLGCVHSCICHDSCSEERH